MKKVTFGYNETIINSKEEGTKIEQFKTISFDLDNFADLKKLELFFRSHVYTLNKFIGPGVREQSVSNGYEGYAANQNYCGMYGVAIDYDDGAVTIEQAEELFKKYTYILHSSSSHMLNIPRHGGIQPRFRVILPFKLSDEKPVYYENPIEAAAVYEVMKAKFPGADQSVFSMGRKFFPFTGDLDRYVIKFNVTNNFFSIPDKELNKKLSNQKKSKNKINRSDVVILKDKRTRVRIDEIKVSGTGVYCIFCDDINSANASAQINIDKHGNYNLYCHHCQKTYWEEDLRWNTEAMPNLYFDIDTGYVATFDEQRGQVKYFRNEKDWESFAHEQSLPREIYKVLPRAKQTFDLKSKFGLIDVGEKKLFNIFIPSKYLLPYEKVKSSPKAEINLSILKQKIPTIYRVFENLFGNETHIRLFINWLAFLIQAREQSSLSWIIISNQGSGKGLLAEHILRPIFGTHSVLVDNGDSIGYKFNAEDAVCWIKVYNEVFTKGDFVANLARREWLKNKIGTNVTTIESKGVNKIQLPNLVNYILFSNYDNAFVLEADDRRFNVVNTLKSAQRIVDIPELWLSKDYTNKQFEARIYNELPALADYIQSVSYNWLEANVATNTPDREKLISISIDDTDFLINKLNEGNAEYFELETLFPSSRTLSGFDANAEIRAQIESFIKNYHAIPSKYAGTIFSYFLKGINKTNIRRRLEQKGMIIGKHIYNKELKINTRCYIHESQIKN